jgi:Fe2+ transport system protein FeoA
MHLKDIPTGTAYRVSALTRFPHLRRRLAILGIRPGMLIELLARYHHGALVRTPFGELALGPEFLESVEVNPS